MLDLSSCEDHIYSVSQTYMLQNILKMEKLLHSCMHLMCGSDWLPVVFHWSFDWHWPHSSFFFFFPSLYNLEYFHRSSSNCFMCIISAQYPRISKSWLALLLHLQFNPGIFCALFFPILVLWLLLFQSSQPSIYFSSYFLCVPLFFSLSVHIGA